MTDIFLGPKRYVQKPGALDEASRHLAPLGRRPAVLADATADCPAEGP